MLEQLVYGDGCFSQDYRSAGVGWVINQQVAGSTNLLGVKSQREINFLAQYYAIKACDGILVKSKPLVIHTTDPVIYRVLKSRKLLESLAVGKDIYDLLDQYTWDVALLNIQDPAMAQSRVLSRDAMHELRDIIKPKTCRERQKFKRKQGKY